MNYNEIYEIVSECYTTTHGCDAITTKIHKVIDALRCKLNATESALNDARAHNRRLESENGRIGAERQKDAIVFNERVAELVANTKNEKRLRLEATEAFNKEIARLTIQWKPSCNPTTQTALEFLGRVGEVLIQKEQGYGDAAKEEVRFFSSHTPAERIRSRLDDKLNRMSKLGLRTEDEDTFKDFVGYLALLYAVELAPAKTGLTTEEKEAFDKHIEFHEQMAADKAYFATPAKSEENAAPLTSGEENPGAANQSALKSHFKKIVDRPLFEEWECSCGSKYSRVKGTILGAYDSWLLRHSTCEKGAM